MEDDVRGLSLEKLDGLTEAYLPEASRLLDAPNPNFLVEGMLLEESITLLVGESGSAKSWIAYDLIRAAATGTPWLARSSTLNQVPVALFNYDNPTSEIKRRFFRLGIPLGKVRLHSAGVNNPPRSCPEMLRVPEKWNVDRIGELIEHNEIKIAVFDSLRQAHMEKEQDSQAMGAVMAAFRAFANAGCSIVILHHTAKGEPGGWQAHARGSGEIAAAADVVIEVSQDKSGKHMTWTKTRGWNPGDQNRIRFKLEDSGPKTRVVGLGQLPGVSEVETTLRLIEETIGDKTMSFDEIRIAVKGTRDGVKQALDYGESEERIVYRRAGKAGFRGYYLPKS